MIPPHGGKLITKVLSRQQAAEALGKGYKRVAAPRDFILDLENIAIGAYSPLTGFMKSRDFASVIHDMRLASGEAWTIPIFFPVEDRVAEGLLRNEKIIICEESGREIGLMRAEEVFSFNKRNWARKVFGTDSNEHPGVKRLFSAHNKIIGGEIWLINRSDFEFEKFNLTPLQTREIIRARGWKTVAGFQTRNVPHRAHEYLQKLALSVTDGILIHPIIGWKKGGDFRPEVIIEAYRVLIDKYFPKGSVIFAGLATAMRYAGPREAVFHAIIRKNYGCTNFVVGRDHAGVGGFYHIYDAHRIFDRFPDLGITPLLFRGPYYCSRCQEVTSDKICPHAEKWHRHISGTMVREAVTHGRDIPEYVVRKEILAILKKYGRRSFI